MPHPEGLYLRDRTEELVVLRRAAKQQNQWLQGKDGAKRADPNAGATDGEAAAAHPTKPPSWVRVLENFDEMEGNITRKIDRLHTVQNDYFSPKFVSQEEEDEQKEEMTGIQGDIQRLIKELERMVTTGIKPADPNNADEGTAAANVEKLLTRRLARLMEDFKNGQQRYVEQLKKRDEKTKRFKKLGSAETHEKLEREEKIAGYLEQGLTQADINELLLEERHQQEQSNEVKDILNSIQEIHQMFSDMKSIVDEQGTVIDRIDYNVEESSKKISRGLDELKKARVEQKKCLVS